MKPDKPKFSPANFGDMFTTEKESKKAGKANYKKYKNTSLYKKSSIDKALKLKGK